MKIHGIHGIYILLLTLLLALPFTAAGSPQDTGKSPQGTGKSSQDTGKFSQDTGSTQQHTEIAAGEKADKKVRAEYDDIMHPKFLLLDDEGTPVFDENGVISSERSCGQCHDTEFINGHNSHYTAAVKADCLVCHLVEGKPSGDYEDVYKEIRLPSNRNCAHCHGMVMDESGPVEVSEDYERNLFYKEGKKCYGITQRTGAVLAPQNLSESVMNIEGKDSLDFPWDIHIRRQVECHGCHFVKNSPRYCGDIRTPLGHLLKDPRRVQDPRQYLKRPNHNFNSAQCNCCHDPFKIHTGLPYKERHMAVLDCQSCHVPELYGPAFRAVDKTVMTAAGTARIEYRGTDEEKSHGKSLNTRYIKGFAPFLFPYENLDKKLNISPFNLVTRWEWKSGKTGEPVPEETVGDVYLSASGYHADIVKLLDGDKNGKVEPAELVLDTYEKVAFIKNKLKAAGIEEPEIAATVRSHKINHGIVESKRMRRDCNDCHTRESRFGKHVLLAANGPAGTLPEFTVDPGAPSPFINGEIERGESGGLTLKRTSSLTGHYVFGHGRLGWMDGLGVLLFIASLLFIGLHGGLRIYFRLKGHGGHSGKTRWEYMYVTYERLWHWIMAAAIILLALTGWEIHNAGDFSLFGLQAAVNIHNVLAAVLVLNVVLSLFYHLATGQIKHFFGFNRKFIQETIVQAYFYAGGIFKGEPHPIVKSTERKLNPLQQLTYIGLLNVLLPFQVITGVLIWGAGVWPALSEKLGGLTYLGPVHNLGSWLFLAFLAVHMYMTTTGHTVFSNIRAMITGYDQVEEDEPHEEHKELMEMPVIDLVGTLIGKFGRKKKAAPSTPGDKKG